MKGNICLVKSYLSRSVVRSVSYGKFKECKKIVEIKKFKARIVSLFSTLKKNLIYIYLIHVILFYNSVSTFISLYLYIKC